MGDGHVWHVMCVCARTDDDDDGGGDMPRGGLSLMWNLTESIAPISHK